MTKKQYVPLNRELRIFPNGDERQPGAALSLSGTFIVVGRALSALRDAGGQSGAALPRRKIGLNYNEPASSSDQTAQTEVQKLKAAGCQVVRAEKLSGKSPRPSPHFLAECGGQQRHLAGCRDFLKNRKSGRVGGLRIPCSHGWVAASRQPAGGARVFGLSRNTIALQALRFR